MLEIAVFLCGAVVMVLELAGSRVLAPFLGTSIVVWTSLIGVVLGSLSLGYWWGGRLADKRPEHKLLSRIILLAALCTLFIAGLKGLLLTFLQNKAGLGQATLFSTLILFAPVSVLLGMVSPFAVRLSLDDAAKGGRTAGNLYALSTVGSISGTFAAGFWLTATVGTTNLVLLMAGVLVLAAFCVHRADIKPKAVVAGLIVVAFAALSAYDSELQAMNLHDIDTPYQRVLVYNALSLDTGERMRSMTTSPEGAQSAMDPDDPVRLVLPYTRYYRLAAHFRPDAARLLMLGGGGYSFPKYALKHPEEFGTNLAMDVVEIDPGVTDIARRHFALEDLPGLALHHDDARRFLNGAQPGSYQVALVDVFTSHLSVPFHLATRETAQGLFRLLDADGVVLVNCIGAAEGPKSRFYRALLATYKSVFPRVESFLVQDPGKPQDTQNIILAAFKKDREPGLASANPEYAAMLATRYLPPAALPGDPPLLTDDFAPVDHYLLSL